MAGRLSITIIRMHITKALGLGILILMLKFLAPEILAEGQDTVLAFLRGATTSAAIGTALVAGAGASLPSSAHVPSALPDFPLPQARQTTPF